MGQDQNQTTVLTQVRPDAGGQPTFLCRWLPDGTFTFVNEACCRQFHWIREEILAAGFTAAGLPAELSELQHCAALLIIRKPAARLVQRLKGPAGRDGWLHWTITAIFSPGGEIAEFQAVGYSAARNKQPADPGRTRRELEVMVRDRTAALRQLNRQLHQEMIGRKARERYISLSNEILQLFTRAASLGEYLEQANRLIREVSGCECAGIRLVDEQRRIPFASAAGLCQEQVQIENGVSLDSTRCLCAHMLAGRPWPSANASLTQFGSFYSSNMPDFIAALPEAEKDLLCGPCCNGRYPTMAIIPIRSRGAVIGAVHLFDPEPNAISMQTIDLIESSTPFLGEGIAKFNLSDKIRESNELLEKIFSTSDLLIAYLNARFEFIRVNAAYAKAGGLSPECYQGRHYFELFPDPMYEAIFHEAVASGAPFTTYAKPMADAAGKIAYWDISLQPVKSQSGSTEGLVLLLHDVTKRKQAEEELSRTRDELADARRLSDIGTLAATVAHELRNPLAAMHMAAYNIRKKARDSQLDKHLATIEKKIAESDQIINNLLFYARLKQPAYEQIPIGEILRECLEVARSRFHRDDVAVQADLAALRHLIIEADPLQIKEVFGNILNNAYEAVAGRTGKIQVSADLENQVLTLRIADNGTGVQAEYLPHIFDPFVTTKAKGTGLGLTVCKQILNLHGGTIDLQSRMGRWTTVTVKLPVCRNLA